MRLASIARGMDINYDLNAVSPRAEAPPRHSWPHFTVLMICLSCAWQNPSIDATRPRLEDNRLSCYSPKEFTKDAAETEALSNMQLTRR